MPASMYRLDDLMVCLVVVGATYYISRSESTSSSECLVLGAVGLTIFRFLVVVLVVVESFFFLLTNLSWWPYLTNTPSSCFSTLGWVGGAGDD